MINFEKLDRKFCDPVTAIAAVVGLGGSMYSSSQASKAQREAEQKAERERLRAEEEARRISEETRPDGTAATIEFGAPTDGTIGSTSDFLTPISSGGSGLGGAGTTTGGLGFN